MTTPRQAQGERSLPARVVLAVILAGLTVPLFLPLRPGDDDLGRVLASATNAAHFPLFYLFARLVYALARDSRGPGRASLLAAGALTGLIAAVETIQPLAGRSSSWEDAGSGFLGAAAGLVACALGERTPLRHRIMFHGFLAILLGLLLRPALGEFAAIRARERRFPALGMFEESAELPLWKGTVNPHGPATQAGLSREHASQGTGSLRVVTPPGKYQGVAFIPGRGQWGGFARFAADVYNPGEAFLLDVDILDRLSTASVRATLFHKRIGIAPGWNHIAIPLDEIAAGPAQRRLLVGAVRKVLFRTGSESPGKVFYLDQVRLLGEAAPPGREAAAPGGGLTGSSAWE